MSPEPIDVSIIIPVRDGARYLEECLTHLRCQTYGNFEVLVVVDTQSTDGTLELAHRLISDFEHGRVIEQSEGYRLSGNRNLGLKHAVGHAVWFLDVDDAPSVDFVKDMFGLLTKHDADFVCCNFVNVRPGGVVKENPGAEYHTKVMDRAGAFVSRSNDEFPVSAWSKMFKRDFLLDNELFFKESFAEDIIHTYRCIECCSKICIYDRPLYAYRLTPNSIVRSKTDMDRRGMAEIESYCLADEICKDDPASLRRNAVMKVRSSGHMTYHTFMSYAKSGPTREAYESYMKGTLEGIWFRYFTPLYWLSIRTYIKLVYKRNGSLGMNKKF